MTGVEQTDFIAKANAVYDEIATLRTHLSKAIALLNEIMATDKYNFNVQFDVSAWEEELRLTYPELIKVEQMPGVDKVPGRVETYSCPCPALPADYVVVRREDLQALGNGGWWVCDTETHNRLKAALEEE
jgi:hypothetical protein